ncbi:uncharacterized protein LOC135834312 [Planococcus citri]|uniref:uncharacterized protein LOC135834312 n=1 Tax=Planococcus citri TaxID=170843 RepID=UPI0031F887E2
MSFICDNCGKSFSRFFNLQRHCKNAHDIILQTQKNNNKEKEPEKHANPNKSSESYSCPIQECDFVGNKTKNFDLHFTNDHPNLEIDKKEMSFQNVEEFMTWKSSVEKQNKCRFVIHTGRTAKYEYYYCHRSGRFTSERTGKRFLKTQGSCKFGSYCPAKICAKISDCGKFNVTFVSTHVGHQHDVAHLTISPNTKKQLAQKMLLKIPDNVIIEDIQESVTDDIQRVHLLTKQDLYNIRREFKIPIDDSKKDENDAISVDLLVQQLRKNDAAGAQSLLIEEITEMIKTLEDNTYFTNELIKLKNHFLLKNSAVQIPVLMSKPTDGEKKTKIQKKADSSSNIIPQRRLYSTKKKTTSKRKKIIKKPTLAEKAAVSSVNFLIPSLQGPQKTGNVILLSQKDVNE